MTKILKFPAPPPPDPPPDDGEPVPDFTIQVGRHEYEIRKRDRAPDPPYPPRPTKPA